MPRLLRPAHHSCRVTRPNRLLDGRPNSLAILLAYFATMPGEIDDGEPTAGAPVDEVARVRPVLTARPSACSRWRQTRLAEPVRVVTFCTLGDGWDEVASTSLIHSELLSSRAGPGPQGSYSE